MTVIKSDWRAVDFSGLTADVFCGWHSSGLCHELNHGFLGVQSALPPESSRRSQATALMVALDLRAVCLLEQIHSNQVLIASGDLTGVNELGVGDAMIADSRTQTRVGLVIYTADCVPILFRCGPLFGAIHAGWRGLANGIIGSVIARLTELDAEDSQLEVVIGPCAGAQVYQVGSEVVEAIGESCVYTEDLKQKRLLLDLRGTAEAQVRLAVARQRISLGKVAVSSQCTITGSYHSYRRDSGSIGRNLSFVTAKSDDYSGLQKSRAI